MRIAVASCILLGAATLSIAQSVPGLLLPQVLRDLASDDFQKRTTAQKVLGGVGLEKREELQKLADSVTDPEVRARLLARVDELNTQEAIEGPLMSLDVKDATPEQLAAALSDATGVWFVAKASPDQPRFTLKVANEHYWNVIDLLNKQRGLTLTPPPPKGDGSWQLEAARVPASPSGTTVGGFRLTSGPVIRQQTAGPLIVDEILGEARQLPGVESLRVELVIDKDPRLEILQMTVSVDPDLRDDQGRALHVDAGAKGDATAAQIGSTRWTQPLVITGAANGEGKIKSIRAVATVRIAVGIETVVIDKPAEHLKQPMKVGNKTFTILDYKEAPNRIDYCVDASGESFEACWLTLITSKETRFEYPFQAHYKKVPLMVNADAKVLNVPLKMEFSAPQHIQTVTLPLEWKEVPIPAKPGGVVEVRK